RQAEGRPVASAGAVRARYGRSRPRLREVPRPAGPGPGGRGRHGPGGGALLSRGFPPDVLRRAPERAVPPPVRSPPHGGGRTAGEGPRGPAGTGMPTPLPAPSAPDAEPVGAAARGPRGGVRIGYRFRRSPWSGPKGGKPCVIPPGRVTFWISPGRGGAMPVEAAVPVNGGVFMGRLLVEPAASLEEAVGPEEAAGRIGPAAQRMGGALGAHCPRGPLGPERTAAAVYRGIDGDLRLLSCGGGRIVLANRS